MITVTDLSTATAQSTNPDVEYVISLTKPPFTHRLHLCEYFADCDYKINFYTVPAEPEQIAAIVNFYKDNNLREKNGIVHCLHGLGRSTSVAMGLMVMFHELTVAEAFDTMEGMRKNMYPNRRVLEHFDNMMCLNGQLVKRLDEWRTSVQGKLIW